MDKGTIKRILNSTLNPMIFFIGILLVWEIIVLIFNIPNYILPSPISIFSEIINKFFLLIDHTLTTMIESLLGFLLANSISFLAAIAFAHSKTIEKGLYPYAIALKTTPIVAMAPILILWFGTGIISKIVTSAVICFFPILVNTIRGLKDVDEDALNLFESLSASKWQVFKKLRLPNSLPYIFSALKISTSLAIVGAIVGEFVGSNKGLGFLILVSSYHLETSTMFAAIIMSALSGILFFYAISFIEKRVVFWKEPEME